MDQPSHVNLPQKLLFYKTKNAYFSTAERLKQYKIFLIASYFNFKTFSANSELPSIGLFLYYIKCTVTHSAICYFVDV